MAQLMGIVNLTPDSFYEGSRARSVKDALARIRQWVDDGASYVDLGAVSTRPGAADVSLEEEWARLEPVLEAWAACIKGNLCQSRNHKSGGSKLTLSIDTTRAEIVRRAYAIIGPFLVNDISAGEDDPDMLTTVAELGLPYVAMHKRGNPRTMDSMNEYDDVVEDVKRYFRAFAAKTEALGIKEWILDPGFGFAKDNEQNRKLFDHLEEFKEFGRPILVGVADKRFTKDDNGVSHSREYELRAIRMGADIIRTHEPF